MSECYISIYYHRFVQGKIIANTKRGIHVEVKIKSNHASCTGVIWRITGTGIYLVPKKHQKQQTNMSLASPKRKCKNKQEKDDRYGDADGSSCAIPTGCALRISVVLRFFDFYSFFLFLFHFPSLVSWSFFTVTTRYYKVAHSEKNKP